jgi:hypothetical protein
MLASLLFPYDDDARTLIEEWLDELSVEGCLTRYMIGSDHYVQVTNWLKHQRIDHPSKSNIPPPEDMSRIFANPREDSCLDQGPRTKDRIKDQGVEGAAQAPLSAIKESSCQATLDNSPPQKTKRSPKPGFNLPDWVPADAWNGFVEMRNRIRKPMTDRAVAGIIKKLDELRARGSPPGVVLDQSTERCWAGVFEVKKDYGNGKNGNTNNGNGSPPLTSFAATISAAVDERANERNVDKKGAGIDLFKSEPITDEDRQRAIDSEPSNYEG